ncbi:hypothetical protein ABIA16_001737 [Sinorhizobium fredii]
MFRTDLFSETSADALMVAADRRYPSALYEAPLGDWLRVESPSFTDGGHARTEVLWINPRAAALVADRRTYQQVELNLEAAE